jgi:hypothetical protein
MLVAVALVAAACTATRTVLPGPVTPQDCADAAEETHAVFLIGDAGAPKLPRHPEAELPVDPVLRNLRDDVMEQVGKLGVDRVTVVFLGDNVYFRGLVPPGESDRARGERILRAQIAAAGPARAIFMAGNHDWEVQGPKGWEHVTAQRDFLAQQGPRVSMLPAGGCPGPERVDFGEYLRFVFIDPIGFGHAIDFPEVHAANCPHPNVMNAFLDLSSEFDHPEGRHVVLALHHPLITAGPHGGHYTLKQHVFPLTDFWPWAWLPLPVIGSLYPLSRQLGVTGTDLSSDEYQGYITGIYRASRPRVPLLYAAGHEHSLQLHRDAVGAYYAVSGSGSKVDRVEPMPTAMFSMASHGYMRLDAHAGGAIGLSVFALTGSEKREPVLRHCLADGPPEPRRP